MERKKERIVEGRDLFQVASLPDPASCDMKSGVLFRTTYFPFPSPHQTVKFEVQDHKYTQKITIRVTFIM